jgi:hypothetical protein
MKRVIVASVWLLAAIVFIGATAAYAAPLAYIDPNTGGMLFQMLAVAFTMLSGFIFFFSSRIKMGFARLARLVREKSGRTAADNGSDNTIN